MLKFCSLLNVKRALPALFLTLLFSCNDKSKTQDFIILERDLVPEGLTVDNRTGIIYVGSTYKRKVIQISPNGVVSDLIPEEKDGIWSPVGLEVDENTGVLWINTAHANEVMPLINPEKDLDWMTGVSAYDLTEKRFIKHYHLESKQAFLNDLTVLPNGDVYVTESVNNSVYRINKGSDKLELFWTTSQYSFLNGIAYFPLDNSIFVTSSEGILKINIESKEHVLLETPPDLNSRRIDGLDLFENVLIGHQSTKVSKFFISPKGNRITDIELIDSGDEFDSSTTGELSEGYYYFIVNSQIRSAIDANSRKIKPVDSLKNIIIRKIKF